MNFYNLSFTLFNLYTFSNEHGSVFIYDEVVWRMSREDTSQARFLLKLINGWKDLIVLLLVQALEGIHIFWFVVLDRPFLIVICVGILI